MKGLHRLIILDMNHRWDGFAIHHVLDLLIDFKITETDIVRIISAERIIDCIDLGPPRRAQAHATTKTTRVQSTTAQIVRIQRPTCFSDGDNFGVSRWIVHHRDLIRPPADYLIASRNDGTKRSSYVIFRILNGYIDRFVHWIIHV
jgi:hypothetical protein